MHPFLRRGPAATASAGPPIGNPGLHTDIGDREERGADFDHFAVAALVE